MAITDKIVVMRKGVVTGTLMTEEAKSEGLSDLMVGRKVNLDIPRKEYDPGEEVLRVQGLKALNQRGLPALRGVDFQVRRGEIVGVAGVEGNGQTELMLALSGLMEVREGRVEMEGENICGLWPDELRRKGIGFIPEDRYQQGLCLDEKISNNIIAGYHELSPYCNKGIMNYRAVRENSRKLVKEYDVRLSADLDRR